MDLPGTDIFVYKTPLTAYKNIGLFVLVTGLFDRDWFQRCKLKNVRNT